MDATNDALVVIFTNLFTIIPPTIMAFAALKSAQRMEKRIGDPTNGEENTTLSERAISQNSTLAIATAILDRMDERLEAVEKSQVVSQKWHDNHEDWHAKGMPERRKTAR